MNVKNTLFSYIIVQSRIAGDHVVILTLNLKYFIRFNMVFNQQHVFKGLAEDSHPLLFSAARTVNRYTIKVSSIHSFTVLPSIPEPGRTIKYSN